MWTWYDREIAEQAWAEYEKELSPAELAEMQRRQDEEREADYFEVAWAEMREANERIQLVYTDKKGACCTDYFDKGIAGREKCARKMEWLANRKLTATLELAGQEVGNIVPNRPHYIWSFDPEVFED
jgi:hypothetical protein